MGVRGPVGSLGGYAIIGEVYGLSWEPWSSFGFVLSASRYRIHVLLCLCWYGFYGDLRGCTCIYMDWHLVLLFYMYLLFRKELYGNLLEFPATVGSALGGI